MHVCIFLKRVSDTAAPDKHIFWIMHSNVEQMKTLAKTLRKERERILNWWDKNSTNVTLEGLNFLVQSIEQAARGFKDTSYFETMILLRLGKLDFLAQTSLACATH